MRSIGARVGSTIIILCSILCLLQSRCSNTIGPDDGRPVQFRVHNGYSVKNTFVGEGSTTCLVFADKATFDSVLDWIADNNPYVPIPEADFQTRIFPVVIKKGNSYWTMGVTSVTYAQIETTLHVYFRATLVADNMSWIAVIPLVLSVQSGDYSTVRFYENGKFIGSVSAAR
jgi:hypothetical protein